MPTPEQLASMGRREATPLLDLSVPGRAPGQPANALVLTPEGQAGARESAGTVPQATSGWYYSTVL